MLRTLEQWATYCKNFVASPPIPPAGARDIPRRSLALVKDLEPYLLEGSRVLDVGCGNARLPIGLDLSGKTDLEYVGLDPIKDAVTFGKCAFLELPQFTFYHLDVRNPRYNPKGTIFPNAVSFDRYGQFDLVVACSVFTHLETVEVARHYMHAISKVMKPNGTLWATWFRSPPESVSTAAAKTVYLESTIRSLYVETGFAIDKTFRGEARNFHDQWVVVGRRT